MNGEKITGSIIPINNYSSLIDYIVQTLNANCTLSSYVSGAQVSYWQTNFEIDNKTCKYLMTMRWSTDASINYEYHNNVSRLWFHSNWNTPCHIMFFDENMNFIKRIAIDKNNTDACYNVIGYFRTNFSISSYGGLPLPDPSFQLPTPEENNLKILFTKNKYFYATNDSNAIASDILINKSAYNSLGKIDGTMPNNGTLNITPNMTQQSIPAGYTSGGTVSSIESTTNYSNWLDKVSNIIGNEIDYELEYIESNGNTTQVNTDIIVNEVTDSVIIDVSNPSLQTWEYLIQYNKTRLAAYSTSVAVLWHQNTRTDVSMNLVSSNKYTLNFSNGSISLNGVSKLTWTPATTETTQSGMILFPKLDTASYFRIYEVKVVRSGEVIHDLVPILHKVNNEYKPCFYDKNTGSYYYNSLSGTLKYKFNFDSYLDYKLDYIKDDLDENLLAGNIKSGVTILGVTGTYTGEEESSE